jgi:hypothetical protein
MCIFTTPVAAVSDTRIFARMAGPGRQYLAYEMSFAAAGDTAMVLPLPVASRDERTALRFLDLSAAPDFFDRIGQFVWMMEERHGSGDLLGGGDAPLRPPLAVHEVGAFEASFVPAVGDFDRLDARFRLPAGVWQRLPQYHDYGFAVFKLRATGRAAQHAHPMAFEFSTRLEDQLYAPTVHVHDGTVHPSAWFDHIVYLQVSHWTLKEPQLFRDGVKASGAEWAREPGDWRVSSESGRVGLVLPARSRHPLLGGGLREREAASLNALDARERKLILRLARHALALEDICKRFAKAIWQAGSATEDERAANRGVERCGILNYLQITADSLRKWRALSPGDRELALQNRPVQAGDPAAQVWKTLHDDTREPFGRLSRWDDLPPILNAEVDAIIRWMEERSAPRREAARRSLAAEFFGRFERVPEALLRAADAQDRARREAIREAVLALEPGIGMDAARWWRELEADDWRWHGLDGLAALDDLWPLFDGTQEIHALGLSGLLPNTDTLISDSG